MNSRFEVCSIVNSSSNSSSSTSGGRQSATTTTVQSGSSALPTPTATSLTSDLTRNGAVNHWTYALSEQYQQSYYPQYQYQGFQYHQQSFYQEQVYQQQQVYYSQQQQYFAQNSYTPVHQQQNAVGAQQQGGEGGQCWVCGAAFQDVALLRDHLALFHAHVLVQTCHLCPAVFPSQTLLAHHFSTCHVVGVSVGSSRTQQLVTGRSAIVTPHPHLRGTEIQKQERRKFISDSGESHKGEKVDLWCVHCRINQFASERDFEAHHLGHVRQRTVKVRLVRLSAAVLKKAKVESSRRRRGSGIKLKLKISKVGRGRGRKRREVRIVSNEGMSDSQNSCQARKRLEAKTREQEEVDGREEGSLPEEKAESGGESEGEQESSRSPTEPQGTEEQLEQDSSPGHDDLDSGKEQDYEQEEQDSQQDSSEQQEQDQEKEEAASSQQKEAQGDYQEASASNIQSDNSNSGFSSGFGEQDLGFGGAGPSEAPSSTYQPQFESFPTSDWFSDYESGPRIAAAMAGATAAETASESSAWAGRTEGTTNTTYPTSDTPPEKSASSPPVNGGTSEGDGEDGLFSQAVLGQESPEKHDRQGSFEQLCLNDSFTGQSQDDNEDQSQQQQQDQSQLSSPQDQQQQASGVANDLLSELEYLNNSGQSSQSSQQDSQPGSQQGSQSGSQTGQLDGSPHSGGPSPHSGGPATPSHLSSRGSNSGTPTSSSGQPTPPPSDTSFRALATSPITSPNQQPTSPSLHKGPTPPAVSPLQQQMQSQLSPQQAGEQQQQQQQQQQAEVPRLTIANNLMAPTTSSHMMATTTASQAAVGGMMSRYGNQWSQGAGYSGTGSYASLAGTSMANTNMSGPLRAPLPPGVPLPYRPSPPPRVRGRPPLMGHVGRPPLHQAAHLQPSRGPGRPPTSSILPPPLMPAPGGRGGMMPPLQRMHQTMYPGQRQASPQQQNAAGKRQLLGAAGHSPSKTARREDINVPSRQKDNECQIIAVANRSDGLPVISNVQGGSAAPGSQQRGAVPSTTESTINLSDSITLSVRASGSNKDAPARGERGGPEAGAVANLLASRGITVTPAAGERQDGAGGRDDRRLPTAQELNLSSAISVHPPTQREREAGGRERDRDGFAVPQAPASRGGGSNSSLERPPRPPTVDLTQDVPSSGAQGTRHKCHQCDRSFPTAALLADHSRVHQQQTQSRMPFKCHLCTAGFSTQKGQQHHYQQFHQIQLSAGDVAIPIVDLRNPVNVQRMAALGIRSFLPLTNLQNRGAGGVVGIPILTLENLRNGHMTLQQWGVSDVLSLGPAKTLNMPR